MVGCAMNGAIHATPAQQRRVRRIDDRIDLELRNVATVQHDLAGNGMRVRQHGEVPDRDDHGHGRKGSRWDGVVGPCVPGIYTSTTLCGADVVFSPIFSMSATPQVIVQQTPQQPSMLSKSTW